MRVVIEVEHPSSDNSWESDELEMTQNEFNVLDEHLKDVATMKHLSFKDDDGVMHHFPPGLLNECVVKVQIVDE